MSRVSLPLPPRSTLSFAGCGGLTMGPLRESKAGAVSPRPRWLLSVSASGCLSANALLKWSDVDWLNGRLSIERAIVRQHVDEVKTTQSRKQMSVDCDMLQVLKAWKQATQFPSIGEWMFASPIQLGRLPWSYLCPNSSSRSRSPADRSASRRVEGSRNGTASNLRTCSSRRLH